MTQTPNSSEVDLDAVKHDGSPEPDGFRQIQEMERAANQRQIETLVSNEGARRDSPSSDTSTTARGTSAQETATDAGGKRLGIDEVLTKIDESLGEEFSAPVRSVLTGYHNTRSEWRDAKAELQNRLDEVNGALSNLQEQAPRPPVGPPDPVETQLNKVTPTQWALFDRMAEDRGYVRQDQLEEQDKQDRQSEYLQDEIDVAIERYGENFGHRDESGKFVFNEGIRDEAQQTFNRLYDAEHGPNARDLFVLSRHEQLVQDAYDRGRDEAVNGAGRAAAHRTNQAMRSVVESRTAASGRAEPDVYATKMDGKVDLDAVIANASAAAYREVPNPI